MKKFAWRLTICLVPLILGSLVVFNAFYQYYNGQGGFRLGVDLVGGTILIYEVDESKFPDGKLPEGNDWKPEELARRLKSRIDPNDLYNITVRVASRTRFEIILPTGGARQVEAENLVWRKLLADGATAFPLDVGRYIVPLKEGTVEQEIKGGVDAIVDAVKRDHPDKTAADVDAVIKTELEAFKTKADEEKKKSLTSAKYFEAVDKSWGEVVAAAEKAFPPKPKTYLVEEGHETALFAAILAQDDQSNVADVRKALDEILKPYKAETDAGKKTTAWKTALSQAAEKYPIKIYSTGRGKRAELIGEIAQLYPYVPASEVPRLLRIDDTGRRTMRGGMSPEDVQEKKDLIAQVGSLEFRIPANQANDSDAMKAARDYFLRVRRDPKLKAELESLALYGKPPPIPTAPSGGNLFDTDKGRFAYSWIELGSDFRYEHGLANPRTADGRLIDVKDFKDIPRNDAYMYFWQAKVDRDDWKDETKPEASGLTTLTIGRSTPGQPTSGSSLLIYSREVPRSRVNDKDREKKVEYYALMRDAETQAQRITGDSLAFAGPSPEGGKVVFRMKPEAGELFYKMTGANVGQLLSVVLDGYLESVATINSAIRTSGEISGNFTPEKVDRTVQVLRSGALPGTLKREPVSENMMGPTLGADTITWGSWSILGAFAAVLIFMVVYYFFAGIVACIALFANLLLTVAFMVLINAAFTLPGLAGLVLTLGMAVDANVLIYERLREERKRGVDLKRAISNGYDRALPTIIDTHLSSIFTAMVLYIVGNDQLKGFGISLTVGLIISLFTSLFITRLIFDIWQDRGWLTKLTMPFDPFSGFKFNFMKWRWVFFSITLGLTILGAWLFISRLDSGGLNIDFVGGTAYGGELAKPVTIEQLREALSKADLDDLSVEQLFISAPGYTEGRASKLFTIRTSEKDIKKVSAEINKTIGGATGEVRLKKISLGDPEYLEDKVVVLSFYDPDAEGKPDLSKPAFASRAQVASELGKVIRDTVEKLQEESKKTDLTAEQTNAIKEKLETLAKIGQQYSILGLGKENEGRSQFMEVRFVEKLDAKNLAIVKTLMTDTKQAFQDNPIPERLERFDSQLADETKSRALYAIVASWAAILLYLWFRFGNWTFGLAAVLCLIHDLFFTLGAIALCHYIYANPVGQALLLQDFKIDLPSVAALLTLVGYSVNDTIVVFDRIREVRGKNPALTEQMINDSVNQTLSRTILASLTTFLVVFVLYVMGGEGVHLFAFVMVIGVMVGTYSSIYIAAPLLLIFGEGKVAGTTSDRPSPKPAGAVG